MGFLANPLFWVLFVAASLLFAKYCRLGSSGAGSLIKAVSRVGFLALVGLAYGLTGWQGGVTVFFGSGLAGILLPVAIRRLLTGPLPLPPAEPATTPGPPRPSLGRPADVRGMILQGIGRAKVWRLIQRGRLLAYENPEDGRVSLVRPEDLDRLRQTSPEEEPGNKT